MNFDEIKEAIQNGKEVYYQNRYQKVIIGANEVCLIIYVNNQNKYELTASSEVEWIDFFIYEAPVSAQEMVELYTASSKSKRERILSSVFGQIKEAAKHQTSVRINKIKFRLDFISKAVLEDLRYKIIPAKDGDMNYTISWEPKSQKEILTEMMEA